MVKLNFHLPPPTLSSLASVAIISSLWKRSLFCYRFKYECQNQPNPNKIQLLDRMVETVQVQHRATISNFYLLAPSVKNSLHDLDMVYSAAILQFLKQLLPLDVYKFLVPKMKFTMRGTVNQMATIRAALPKITDKNERFTVICKYALADMKDDAWAALTSKDVKFYVDLWEANPQEFRRGCYYGNTMAEIYVVLVKIGKLQELTSALVLQDDEITLTDPTEYLFIAAALQGLTDLAKHCLGLIPTANQKRLFTALTTEIDQLLLYGQCKDSPEVEHPLSALVSLLQAMSTVDIMSAINGSIDKLICRFLIHKKFLPLVMPILRLTFDRITPASYLAILNAFVNKHYRKGRVCHPRKAVLIQMWVETPNRLKSAVLNSELSTAVLEDLFLAYDNDVVVEFLKGRRKSILFNVGLPFCKSKLKQHASNYTYVRYSFVQNVIPEKYRTEFSRRLLGLEVSIDEDEVDDIVEF